MYDKVTQLMGIKNTYFKSLSIYIDSFKVTWTVKMQPNILLDID